MSILDHFDPTTKQDARTRVLEALRGAGSKGLRRDALEDASQCRSVVQRVQELRDRGHVIESRSDTSTDFSIYTLTKEAKVETTSTTQTQIRMTLSKPRSTEAIDRLRESLLKVIADWEESEDKVDDFDLRNWIE